MPRHRGYVFDAYGTLFDQGSPPEELGMTPDYEITCLDQRPLA